MKHDGRRVIWHRELADTILQISAFQVDRRGELLVADYAGGINRLVRAPERKSSCTFPHASEPDRAFHVDEPLPLEPLRSFLTPSTHPAGPTAAEAERFMAVPGDAKVAFGSSSPWIFPDGTALVQTLSLDRQAGNATQRFRVETRVLLRQQGEWAGYSYRWNSEQTDASLVAKNGEDAELDLGKLTKDAAAKRWKWRFPSRSECMACHSRAANFALGVTGSQLNRDHDYNGVLDNQLRALDHIGFFTGALPKLSKDLERLVDPRDDSQDLELRARTYLHVNCSVCHVEAGGGNSRDAAVPFTPRRQDGAHQSTPATRHIRNHECDAGRPGAPERSVLLRRLSGAVAARCRRWCPTMSTWRRSSCSATGSRSSSRDQVFVREWRMDDLVTSLDDLGSGRSIESGRKAFRDTGCLRVPPGRRAGGKRRARPDRNRPPPASDRDPGINPPAFQGRRRRICDHTDRNGTGAVLSRAGSSGKTIRCWCCGPPRRTRA